MGNHRLLAGKGVIGGLSAIGRALRYHVEEEFPIRNSATAAGQPVDVAWFSDSAERVYPLMVFEVETQAGNTIANNPLKVFAQDNRVLEKPLFFFHIIVAGGTETARIEQLERQYGTHNYRLYRLALGEKSALIRDILAQHRRLSRKTDYVKLYEALTVFGIGDDDRLSALTHARNIGLSSDDFLAASVRLARRDTAFLSHLPTLMESEYANEWPTIGQLPNWWASWGPMIVIAWLAGRAPTPEDAVVWDDRLMTWQNENAFMPMLCSAIELSRDYAEFLVGVGGPFVAFIAALMRGRGNAPTALCNVLVEVLRKIPRRWDGLQLATWILHLAARLKLPEAFCLAEGFIAEAGGVSRADLLTPPSAIEGLDTRRAAEWEPPDGSDIPTLSEFGRLARDAHPAGCDRTALMLALLDEPAYHLRWNREVLACLWQSDPD